MCQSLHFLLQNAPSTGRRTPESAAARPPSVTVSAQAHAAKPAASEHADTPQVKRQKTAQTVVRESTQAAQPIQAARDVAAATKQQLGWTGELPDIHAQIGQLELESLYCRV